MTLGDAPPPGTLAELQSRFGRRYRWLLLLAVMVGTMASIMSSTIVNVAIPDLSGHFSLGQERAQWVSSSFMVAMTVSMLTTPWLLMRYGYRRVYSACMVLLLVGGVAGGLANDFNLVLLARLAEGLAAGIVQPIPAIIILRAFEPHEQGRASAVFGTGVVLAPAVGPSIGGVLVDLWGWRSIFYMVVPFCLVALWLARRYVPVTAPGGLAADRDGAGLDWWGLLGVTVATVALLAGLVALRDSGRLYAVVLLGIAAAATIAFVWLQRQLLHGAAEGGRQPLLNGRVFASRRYRMGSLVAFIYGAALFGSTYLVPVYLQMGLKLSAAYVGTLLLPAGLVLAATIALVGRLADRQPPHRLVGTGLVLLSVSFAAMVTVGHHTAMTWLLAWVVLGRIGLGFILPSLNLGAMRGLPTALIPQGASAINFLRMLGGAAGVGLCGVALEWRLVVHGPTLRAFNEVFVGLAILCALALLAAFRMRDDGSPSAAVKE